MIDNRETKWQRYKNDFLRVNKCTVDEFERDYIGFMETKPNTKAYRHFARKYSIIVHPDPRIPDDVQLVLCVNIAAIKVMAETHTQAENLVTEILSGLETKH